MSEAERVLARKRRALGVDQLLTNERHQVRGHPLAGSLWREFPDGADEEVPPDDRRRLEHGALLEREAIKASGEQRVDRRRNGDGRQVAGHAATRRPRG